MLHLFIFSNVHLSSSVIMLAIMLEIIISPIDNGGRGNSKEWVGQPSWHNYDHCINDK